VLTLAGDGAIELHAPVDLVREVLHHRARRLEDRAQAATEALTVTLLCVLYPLEPYDAPMAIELFRGHPRLSPRAAFLVAFAQRHSLTEIVSTDGSFDGLPGLQRVNPGDGGALAALGG
jgi:predicted nucleic acid-binding protein